MGIPQAIMIAVMTANVIIGFFFTTSREPTSITVGQL